MCSDERKQKTLFHGGIHVKHAKMESDVITTCKLPLMYRVPLIQHKLALSVEGGNNPLGEGWGGLGYRLWIQHNSSITKLNG